MSNGEEASKLRDNLVALFPKLEDYDFAVTSQPTRSYNCVAWVLRDTQRWWDTEPKLGAHWPEGLEVTDTILDYERLFGEFGFEICQDDDLEHGLEKIALLSCGGIFLHVAFQLPNGHWSSKLGTGADIRHETVEQLLGAKPAFDANEITYMSRPRQKHEAAESPLGVAS